MTSRNPSSAITHIFYHVVDHMTGYLLKVKYFPNILTPKKPRGGVATPHPSYHGRGISLRVRPRVTEILAGKTKKN